VGQPSYSVGTRLRLGRAQLALWRPTWSWVRGVVRAFVTSFLALTASLWFLPGVQVERGAESVASLAVLALALGAMLRPLITRLTVLTGVLGLLVAGLLAQVLVLWLALQLVPSVRPFSFGDVFVASWAAAVAAACVNWLFDTSSDEVFLGQLLGRAARHTDRAGSTGPGLLVVQLDGVSEPVLRQAIAAGSMPTLSRWIRSGTHSLRAWHTGMPATTPAAQAALLHGDDRSVPGFRWYDKQRGRLLTMSRPADVAEVEARLSSGDGLLRDGGASISNIFSGDAPVRRLTLSDARLPASDRGAATYASLRVGFTRSITLFVGQMIAEWHQARRQRMRGVEPRVHRGGTFLLLRGVTTVLLRDLNVSIVAEHLTEGTPVVFVDFVDYDEVAHHAGPTRPESLRTLENLDRVLNLFDQLVKVVGRRYELVVLSDHGQAQGATFHQLDGTTLQEVVHRLTVDAVVAPANDTSDETWIPATLLAAGAGGVGGVVSRAARSATRSDHDDVRRRGAAEEPSDVVVAVSGSLAHVYVTGTEGRLTRQEVDARYPELVDGLAAHDHIGAVVTLLTNGDLAVEAPGGRVDLRPGATPLAVSGHGRDPLAAYGRRAASDLVALSARADVGDVILLGAYDEGLGEVAAFEELVGSHGGLGGWQNTAFVLHPAGWKVPADALTGVGLHRVLVRRLEELGVRESGHHSTAGPTPVTTA
jgi:hypothetical protein